MRNSSRIFIVVALVTAVAVLIVAKNKQVKSTAAASAQVIKVASSANASSGPDGATCPGFDPEAVAPVQKNGKGPKLLQPGVKPAEAAAPTSSAMARITPTQTEVKLPKLVDVGSTTCKPCKMMIAVMDELSNEYPGQLEVTFIDIKERDQATPYGIRAIPTQILYDRKGEEFFRHEGYYSKQDILKKFKDHGMDFERL